MIEMIFEKKIKPEHFRNGIGLLILMFSLQACEILPGNSFTGGESGTGGQCENEDPETSPSIIPFIQGWEIPEQASSGETLSLDVSVSGVCNNIESMYWIINDDTIQTDSTNLEYQLPMVIHNNLPVAFVLEDVFGNKRTQVGSISVGTWRFISENEYTMDIFMVTENSDHYVILTTEWVYPDYFPILLFISKSGTLLNQIRINKVNFRVRTVVDNQDGTFLVGGGLTSGSTGTVSSSAYLAHVDLSGSILSEVVVDSDYGYRWISRLHPRSTGDIFAIVNKEEFYRSGTAVGSNYCPTKNIYLMLDHEFAETNRIEDSTWSCGMIMNSLASGDEGYYIIGYERNENYVGTRSFLLWMNNNLEKVVVDVADGEFWKDFVLVDRTFYFLVTASEFYGGPFYGDGLRIYHATSESHQTIRIEKDYFSLHDLIYHNQSLYFVGIQRNYSYGEPDQLFLHAADLEGNLFHQSTRLVGGNTSAWISSLQDNSLMVRLAVPRPSSIFTRVELLNFDSWGNGTFE